MWTTRAKLCHIFILLWCICTYQFTESSLPAWSLTSSQNRPSQPGHLPVHRIVPPSLVTYQFTESSLPAWSTLTAVGVDSVYTLSPVLTTMCLRLVTFIYVNLTLSPWNIHIMLFSECQHRSNYKPIQWFCCYNILPK